MITDDEFLEMLHRLTDEEKVAIFSRMILMEKWRIVTNCDSMVKYVDERQL